MVIAALIPLLGCNACNNLGSLKCEDNKLFVCQYRGADAPNAWVENIDCTKSRATCAHGKVDSADAIIDLTWKHAVNWDDVRKRSLDGNCIIDDIKCEADDSIHCSEDGNIIYACGTIRSRSVAVTDRVNTRELPYCVESEDTGDASFAYRDGTWSSVGICMEGSECREPAPGRADCYRS
jgi:hypothetical protein